MATSTRSVLRKFRKTEQPHVGLLFRKGLGLTGRLPPPANGVSVDYGPVPRSAPLLPKSFKASAGITTGLMSPLSSILFDASLVWESPLRDWVMSPSAAWAHQEGGSVLLRFVSCRAFLRCRTGSEKGSRRTPRTAEQNFLQASSWSCSFTSRMKSSAYSTKARAPARPEDKSIWPPL